MYHLCIGNCTTIGIQLVYPYTLGFSAPNSVDSTSSFYTNIQTYLCYYHTAFVGIKSCILVTLPPSPSSPISYGIYRIMSGGN